MKFAHYITVLERDAPKIWQGKFVKYKQLKKQLKRCHGPGAEAVNVAEEEAFFAELHSQLASINRHFHSEAERTVDAFERSTQGLWVIACFIPLWWTRGARQYAALADRAYWCRKYARANAVALRKILKKHDKVCGNGRGRNFLQQCWCSGSPEGVGLFLHSPLLDELKAVQDVLQHKIEAMETVQPLEEGHPGLMMPRQGEKEKATVVASSGVVSPPHSDEERDHAAADAARTSSGRQTPYPAPISPPGATAAAADTAHAGLPSLHPLHRTSLTRVSPSAVSASSDGLRGACAPSHSSSIGSLTTPSLKAQRTAALAAIQESPSCMLDSSDIEWEGDSPLASQSVAAVGRWPAAASTAIAPSGPGPSQPRKPEKTRDAVTSTDANEGIDPDAPVVSPVKAEEGAPAGGATAASGGPVTGGSSGWGDDIGPGSTVDGGGSSGVGPVLGPFRDEELRCPICLDLMYKPVGLGCGHKFCRPCALEAAGFSRACGAFNNIISYIPARTTCPQCRQANVYRQAVSLKEVGSLIRTRYPELWAERRAEDRRRRRDASNSSSITSSNSRPRVASMLGATPYDLINTVPVVRVADI